MWFLFVVAAVVVVFIIVRRKDGKVTTENTVKVQWKDPDSDVELLTFLAMMGEAISGYEHHTVSLSVDWIWGERINDEVHIGFYGINETAMYRNTSAWKYLSEGNTEIYSKDYHFVYKFGEEHAPNCFRGKDYILEFVNRYAPSAYCDPDRQFGTNESYDAANHRFREWANISFMKHDVGYEYFPERIDTAIMNAIRKG